MSYECPSCHADCRPREKNSLGYQIEEFLGKEGWVPIAGSQIHPSRCEAINYLATLPNSTNERRVYSATERNPC